MDNSRRIDIYTRHQEMRYRDGKRLTATQRRRVKKKMWREYIQSNEDIRVVTETL